LSTQPTDAHLNPVRVLSTLERCMSDNSIIVADGGDFVGTAAYLLRYTWCDRSRIAGGRARHGAIGGGPPTPFRAVATPTAASGRSVTLRAVARETSAGGQAMVTGSAMDDRPQEARLESRQSPPCFPLSGADGRSFDAAGR